MEKIDKFLSHNLVNKYIMCLDSGDYKPLRNKGVSLIKLGLYEEAIECFDKVLKIKPDDYISLRQKGDSLISLGRCEEAIECIDQALKIKPDDYISLRQKGNYLHFLGKHEETVEWVDRTLGINREGPDYSVEKRCSLTRLGLYKEAIECFDQALKIKPDDYMSLSFKASTLSKMGRYEEAVEWYDQALKIKHNDYNSLRQKGVSLHFLGRESESIEWYNQALKIKHNDYLSLRSKGVSLHHLGQYKEAIECFDQALEIKYDYWQALVSKALSLEALGEDEKAIEIYDSISNNLDKEIDTNIIELVNFKKHAVKKKKDDTKTDVLNEIINKIQGPQKDFFDDIDNIEFKFKKFIDSERSIPKDFCSFLSILRKWNSYTPILPSEKGDNKGGGYFLYHCGKGIVIDPGFNFVENFYQEGFKVEDIDAVLITHAHNDHTVDLESILTLVYKHNDAIKDTVIEEMKGESKDKIGEKIKERLKDQGKKIDLFMNLGTFMKYSGWLNIKDSNEVNNVTVLMPNTEYKLPEDYCGIKIYTTKAKHHEVVDERYSIGFILEINEKIKVGFTGDTGWDWDSGEIMVKPFKNIKPQLVVAHLGSIKRKEFEYVKKTYEAEKNDCFYSHHLGLLGITRFLEETKPQLTIVSEFGEELREKRKLIVESIGNVLGLNCLPGDIGLHIRLCDLSVHCFIKEDFVDYKSIRVFSDPADDGSTLLFYGEDPDHQRFNNALSKKRRRGPTSLAKRTKSYYSKECAAITSRKT